MSAGEKIRIDKWLWAARFFKTRALASNAVNGGKVHANGKRVKSSRSVCVGDKLEISRSHSHVTVMVKALSEKRGPAKQAQMLYEETSESIEKRELNAQQRKLLNAGLPQTKTRPDKRQRRQLRKVSGKL